MISLVRSTDRQREIALTILRVVVGVIFFVHGWQKLFTFGVAGITGGFSSMGVPVPVVTAPLVTLLEFAGGIALIAGFLTRVVALGLACDMLGAILIVHGKNGFFAPKGYEFVLSLLTAAIALVIAGGGSFSIDNVIARRTTRA